MTVGTLSVRPAAGDRDLLDVVLLHDQRSKGGIVSDAARISLDLLAGIIDEALTW
jgi:hypothetical protein